MNQQQSQEVEQYMALRERELENERLRRLETENQNMQLSGFENNKGSDLARLQIEMNEEKDQLFHTLSGHVLKSMPDGSQQWIEPPDDRSRILSSLGVEEIMKLMSFYLNKIHLLGYYTPEEVIWKVRDFALELNDLLYCGYELFFSYPSPEELYEKYLPLLQNGQIKGITQYDLYKKCNQWSQEELERKIIHYDFLVKTLTDIVHSIYSRAIGGKERDSFTRRVNVTQSISNPNDQSMNPQKRGVFSKLNVARW